MEVRSQLQAPAALPSGERAIGTHWMQAWVGPRADLEAVAKRKKYRHFPCWELNTGRPAGH